VLHSKPLSQCHQLTRLIDRELIVHRDRIIDFVPALGAQSTRLSPKT